MFNYLAMVFIIVPHVSLCTIELMPRFLLRLITKFINQNQLGWIKLNSVTVIEISFCLNFNQKKYSIMVHFWWKKCEQDEIQMLKICLSESISNMNHIWKRFTSLQKIIIVEFLNLSGLNLWYLFGCTTTSVKLIYH